MKKNLTLRERAWVLALRCALISPALVVALGWTNAFAQQLVETAVPRSVAAVDSSGIASPSSQMSAMTPGSRPDLQFPDGTRVPGPGQVTLTSAVTSPTP